MAELIKKLKKNKFKTELEHKIEDAKDTLQTKYSKEEENKIINEEQLKFVETMEDDAKALSHVTMTETAKQAALAKQQEQTLDQLDSFKHSYSAYRANLAEWGMWKLMNIEWPIGWEYHCVPTTSGTQNIYGKNFNTKEGIIFVVKDPRGKVYIRAMLCHYDPEIDSRAVTNYVIQAENTLDTVKGVIERAKKQELDSIVEKYTPGKIIV